MDAQLRHNREAIVTRLAQRLAWEMRNVSGRQDFERSAEVARLAIELAKLRGKREPDAFLDEAARLLSGASRALAVERERPEREGRAMETQLVAESDELANRANPRVQFSQVVNDGTEASDAGPLVIETEDQEGKAGSVKFEPYKTIEGFRRLLERHAARVCAEAGERIRKQLSATPPDAKKAAQMLEDYSHTADEVKKLAAVRSIAEGERFLKRWEATAQERLVRYLLNEAKAGELRAVNYLAFWRTRQLGEAAKTAAAREARAKRGKAGAKERAAKAVK